jgi:pyruvate ferredoxin oxidoreductase alpha subunit
MDRSLSFGGNGGAVYPETRHALYDLASHPYMTNYIYGLGGRDIKIPDIQFVFESLFKVLKTGKVENLLNYLGIRE